MNNARLKTIRKTLNAEKHCNLSLLNADFNCKFSTQILLIFEL